MLTAQAAAVSSTAWHLLAAAAALRGQGAQGEGGARGDGSSFLEEKENGPPRDQQRWLAEIQHALVD